MDPSASARKSTAQNVLTASSSVADSEFELAAESVSVDSVSVETRGKSGKKRRAHSKESGSLLFASVSTQTRNGQGSASANKRNSPSTLASISWRPNSSLRNTNCASSFETANDASRFRTSSKTGSSFNDTFNLPRKKRSSATVTGNAGIEKGASDGGSSDSRIFNASSPTDRLLACKRRSRRSGQSTLRARS